MSWATVAKKEYLENVRNAWVITVTIAFLLLTLLASSFARVTSSFDGSTGFADIVNTVAAMQSFSGFLLPILALVLGFGTIAGERESGSLALLTAQPLSRGDIILGKWIGLWSVLATAILIGFGTGGIIVLTNTDAGSTGYRILGLFILLTLLWGAAWISVTLLMSSFFNRRGTAIAGSVGLWFLFGSFVWNMLTLLLAVATMGTNFQQFINNGTMEAPGWFILTQLLNPNAVYSGLLATTIEGYPTIIGQIAQELLPTLYTPYVLGLALAAWIGIPYVTANHLFHRKDI